jgi:Cu-Zn family superoxide dismutase
MIVADANGVSQDTFVVRGLTVSEGAHSIVGKALIVHADADDYTTQPTGNSGARIACGVVK